MSTYVCQSCGKPTKKPVDRGTNLNGTLSARYCAQCYSMGEFTLPDLTAEEMQARVANRQSGLGWPGFMARWLARNVPKLDRWTRPPGNRPTR